MAGPDGVRIGLDHIYEVLVTLRDDVRDLKSRHTDMIEKISDHEDRIRSIERWKYAIPLATLSAVATVFVSLLGGKGAA